jgi:hypothetical protein
MDANQRTGVGIILMGISALLMTVPITTTTAYSVPYSVLMPVAGVIAGLSLTGIGVGTYMGRFETTSGTASKRTTTLIAIIAVAAFATGVLLAVL